jgi:putative ABC transport system permease protein
MWTLARKILLHDRIKFAVAGAGVSISVLLVLVQIGLYLGFMQNASNLIDHAKADLWITSEANENFDFPAPMDDRVLYRVEQVAGVERAEPMILSFGQYKLPTGGNQGVQVVGVEREGTLMRPWNVVAGNARRLGEVDGVVVDRTEFGKLHVASLGAEREITGVKSRVVALTDGIRSFTTSPLVFTNIDTARTYTNLTSHQISYVLVKLAKGADVASVKASLERIPHIDVYTQRELSNHTRTYWSSRTGVGAGMFTTAILGVIVGLVVVGQILYNGTLEHIREYGTLKAMGAPNGAIVRVILYQALISAAVGFVVGGALAIAAQAAMRSANLSVLLTPSLIAGTAALTAVMCAAAALLSILKVLRLDPATVFKG